MVVTTPLKKSPSIKELMASANTSKEVSTVEK